jgi:hypothetical protein
MWQWLSVVLTVHSTMLHACGGALVNHQHSFSYCAGYTCEDVGDAAHAATHLATKSMCCKQEVSAQLSGSGLRQDPIVQDVIARMLELHRMLLHTLLLACCQLPRLESAVTSAAYGVCNNACNKGYEPRVLGVLRCDGRTASRRAP